MTTKHAAALAALDAVVVEFLNLLKGEATEGEETSYDITREVFLNGGCYRLYRILLFVFPEAEAYKVDFPADNNRCDGAFVLSHVVTRINGTFYDIDGEFILSKSPYARIAKMNADDHALAMRFCYSFTRRGAIGYSHNDGRVNFCVR